MKNNRKKLLDKMMMQLAGGWDGLSAFSKFIERFPAEFLALAPLKDEDYEYIKSKMVMCRYCEYWYFKGSLETTCIGEEIINGEKVNICGNCKYDISHGDFDVTETFNEKSRKRYSLIKQKMLRNDFT